MTIPGERRKIIVVDATHLAAPITELEQARAHLTLCQETLRILRAAPKRYVRRRDHAGIVGEAKSSVLAALSWVWDAQERDVYYQVKSGIEDMARVLKDRGVDPTTLFVPYSPELREALRIGWQGLIDLQLVNVSAPRRRPARSACNGPRG